MMAPWDGLWTEELLRDLTGGVTRSGGKVEVICDRWKPLTVERYAAHPDRYLVGRKSLTAWQAVDDLNQQQAVPVNDDGTPWKVTLPDDW